MGPRARLRRGGGGIKVCDAEVIYLKATHGTKKMWAYITGRLTNKSYSTHRVALYHHIMWSLINSGLKIKGCKIRGTTVFAYTLTHAFTAEYEI